MLNIDINGTTVQLLHATFLLDTIDYDWFRSLGEASAVPFFTGTHAQWKVDIGKKPPTPEIPKARRGRKPKAKAEVAPAK